MKATFPPGFYPFWFWNADIGEDEIRWQVNQMACQGIRGFAIHPRQGMEQPYLSAGFFDRVRLAVAEAARHGMKVVLYDEYPYPSGAAGGQVALGHPEFMATRLEQKISDVEGGPCRLELPAGDVLSCVAVPWEQGRPDWTQPRDLRADIGTVYSRESFFTRGLTGYNRTRYFAHDPIPVLQTHLPPGRWRIVWSVQTIVAGMKYFGASVDVMNPRAIKRFIALTHERYRRELGDELGRTVAAFFCDEIEADWSRLLPELFRKDHDDDLIERLPALADATHPQHVETARMYRQTLYDAFVKSWEDPVGRWCRGQRLAYTGEKSSLRLAQLRHMDLPGGDPGHTKAGAPGDLLGAELRSNARATASAGYFYHGVGALCECFHSTGWGFTLQDARLITDGLLLLGVTHVVPHAFFYSTHGLRKHDAPPSNFFQMPYWPLTGRLTERAEKVLRLFGDTHIAARVLVYEPHAGLATREQLGDYSRLLQMLMEERLEFMLVDTDILEAADLSGGKIRIREIAADVLVIPPVRRLEPAMEQWLTAFRRVGGVVVEAGESFDRDALAQALRAGATPSLDLSATSGNASPLQVVHRAGRNREYWMVLNPSASAIVLEFRPRRHLAEVPLEGPVQLVFRDGRYVRRIAPFESLLLTAADAPPGHVLPVVEVDLSGPCEVHQMCRNVLPLDRWDLSLLDESGGVTQTATGIKPAPAANHVAECGLRIAPKVVARFGQSPRLEFPLLRLRYVARFENRFAGRVELVMEPESLAGDWRLRVNDAVFGPSDFTPTESHVRGSLGVDVTSALRVGGNEISVDLTTGRDDGGLLNRLYLAGDFAVELPRRLAPPSLQGQFEQYEFNGLPFYAGVIDYTMQRAVKSVPGGSGDMRCGIGAAPLPAPVPTGPRSVPAREAEPLHFMAACGRDANGCRGPVAAQFILPANAENAMEISVNGGPFLAAPWSPWRVELPPDALKPGANDLRVRVYTTLLRAFEGQYFDTATPRAVDVCGVT